MFVVSYSYKFEGFGCHCEWTVIFCYVSGVTSGVGTSWQLSALQRPPTLPNSDRHSCLIDGHGVPSLRPWEGVWVQRWMLPHSAHWPGSREWRFGLPALRALRPRPGSRKTRGTCAFWQASHQAKEGVMGVSQLLSSKVSL